MIILLMCIILFAAVAMLYTDGTWSNALRLINVVTAALLAVNFYEHLADWLETKQPTYTYFWDFLALWGLFVVFSAVFRVLTDFLSRVKVRFLKIADQIGSVILSLWIGWVMVCFTMVTLHTAPLARNFMDGSFDPEQRMVLGLAPDRQWLGFMQRMSQGPYARSAGEAEWKGEKYVFDPDAEFLLKYATRRANFESHVKHTGKLRVLPGE